MRAAGVCPHCASRISPARLMFINRRRPYECRTCGSRSVIDHRSGIRAVVVYVAALAVPLFVLEAFGVPRVVLFIACLAGVLALPVVFARICRFEPARDRDPAE